jgi:NADPH2:quinone reductase
MRDGVVIAVRGCGICGTDLHLVSGDLGLDRLPLVPGHESWGEVLGVGADVASLRVGDVVAVDPSLHCGQCSACRTGKGNMCHNWGAIGGTVPGAWADFVAVPAANCHPLGPSFPLDVAGIIEPVACAIRGLERLNPRPDEAAIVLGAGTMGMILALLLQARGVGPVTIVDINATRRSLASQITGLPTCDPEELGDLRAPWVIEATGNARAFEQAIDSVERAGSVLVFGVASPQARAQVSPHKIYADELTIVGSMAILRSFGAAVSTTERHGDALRPLITHRLALDDISRGLDLVSSGEAVKVMIEPGVR